MLRAEIELRLFSGQFLREIKIIYFTVHAWSRSCFPSA